MWSKLWKLNFHDQLKMFLLRIKAGVVLTKVSIVATIDGGNTSCVICYAPVESCFHLFKECPFVRALAFASK